MKKVSFLLTVLFTAVSMTAFAADKAADAKADEAKPAQEKKADGKKRMHHKNRFHGEVKAVDAKTGTITVSRGERTFAADEKLLADVKVGDRVSVKFADQDGKLTATAIRPAKAHHKKHEAKKDGEKAEEKK